MSVIELKPRRVATALTLLVAAMVAASLVGQVIKYRFGHDYVLGFVPLTDVNGEANFPSWYSSSSLLVCALLLFLIAAATRGRDRARSGYWFGLAALFTFLSLDEAAQFHERLNRPLSGVLPDDGIFHFAWVLGGLAFVLAVGLAYLRFVLGLPKPTRLFVFLAGALYVGGALGVEMLGAAHAAGNGREGLGYAGWTTVEELMEMLGVVAFLYALLTYLGSYVGPVTIRATGRRVVTGLTLWRTPAPPRLRFRTRSHAAPTKMPKNAPLTNHRNHA